MTLRSSWTVARTNAALILTGEVVGALAIVGALGSFAAFVRVTQVAVLAVATCFVVTVYLAKCVNTALSDQASVDALTVDARLSERTLVVAATTNCKYFSLIRLLFLDTSKH